MMLSRMSSKVKDTRIKISVVSWGPSEVAAPIDQNLRHIFTSCFKSKRNSGCLWTHTEAAGLTFSEHLLNLCLMSWCLDVMLQEQRRNVGLILISLFHFFNRKHQMIVSSVLVVWNVRARAPCMHFQRCVWARQMVNNVLSCYHAAYNMGNI